MLSFVVAGYYPLVTGVKDVLVVAVACALVSRYTVGYLATDLCM